MRMFRSFVLRMALILSTTGVVCLMLMTATLGIQGEGEAMFFCGTLFLILFCWLGVNFVVVRKTDPEMSVEVARMLLPSAALLSILLSLLLSMYLDDMSPGEEGKQDLILPFVGIGVAFFLLVRCFDIKWLRGEEEIAQLEAKERK